jgi:hypothetical protein
MKTWHFTYTKATLATLAALIWVLSLAATVIAYSFLLNWHTGDSCTRWTNGCSSGMVYVAADDYNETVVNGNCPAAVLTVTLSSGDVDVQIDGNSVGTVSGNGAIGVFNVNMRSPSLGFYGTAESLVSDVVVECPSVATNTPTATPTNTPTATPTATPTETPTPTTTPPPVLSETIYSPTGDYRVEHTITWGEVGIVSALLLVAGLQLLTILTKVPSWLRH